MKSDDIPLYARETDAPIECVFSRSGPFGLAWDSEVELRQGGERVATVDLNGEGGLFAKELARIDFGGRVFRQTLPPDRGFGEAIAEFISNRRWRRVWRAGSGVVTEVRNITQDPKSVLKASFQRDGTSYVVERPIETSLMTRTEGDIRLMANHREVAGVEESMENKAIMLFTPNAPLRLDVIAIAFDLGMALVLPRGGGGAGGGGGGDGGGGC